MNAVSEKLGKEQVKIDLGENWIDIREQIRKICKDFPRELLAGA